MHLVNGVFKHEVNCGTLPTLPLAVGIHLKKRTCKYIPFGYGFTAAIGPPHVPA